MDPYPNLLAKWWLTCASLFVLRNCFPLLNPGIQIFFVDADSMRTQTRDSQTLLVDKLIDCGAVYAEPACYLVNGQ
jgi:hypothetical protein